MILSLSTRKGEGSVFRHGPPSWRIGGLQGSLISEEAALEILQDMPTYLLLHGYNVTQAEGAYMVLHSTVGEAYKHGVWGTWPGSKLRLGFWSAKSRANTSGKLFAEALTKAHPKFLDIQAHSLGCRVALEAMKHGLKCRNLILAGAAVNSKSLGKEYADACKNADRILVVSSKADDVLKRAYKFALWNEALGWAGPTGDVPPNVSHLDITPEVPSHSKYKGSKTFIEYWMGLLK